MRRFASPAQLVTVRALILSAALASPEAVGAASPPPSSPESVHATVSLPKLDATQPIAAGQVVGLFGTGLSLSTAGADRVLVVARSASDLGGKVSQVPVALLGLVPVQVSGPVRTGDLLVASGRNDGTAVRQSASEISPALLPLLVGRALEANSLAGQKSVQALVGVPDAEALVALLGERDALLEAQAVEIFELRAKVAVLETMNTEVAALRRAVARLVALEEARKPEQLAPPRKPE